MRTFLKSQVGWLFGLSFCLLTALSTTFIHQIGSQGNPFFSLCCTTLLAILYFHFIKMKQIKFIYFSLWKEKKLWFLISAMVAGNWMCAFYSLSKIDSFTYTYVYFSSSAIIGLLTQYQKNKKINYLITATGLFFCLSVFFNHHDNHAVLVKAPSIGFIFAIISAGFGYSYRLFSVKFSEKTKLDAASVLAIRFYLLLLISLLFSRFYQFHAITVHQSFNFILLAVVTFLMPLYCMQRSVLLIGSNHFSILTALCPVMTASLLLFFYHTVSDFNFVIALMMFGLILANGMFTFHQNKKILIV